MIPNVEPYYADVDVVLYHGDCRELLPLIPEGSIDLVLTDPPYGIPQGAVFAHGKRRDSLRGTEGFNAASGPYDWFPLLLPRALCDGGHVAIFLDLATSGEAIESLKACGVTPWHKYYLVKASVAPTPRPLFASAVEECVIAEKRNGRRHWYGGGACPNRWIGMTPNQLGAGHGHETEKPLEPMLVLVSALTPENAVVLDPFAGSGTTGVAAKQLGRKCVLIEIEEKYCAIAAKRLEATEKGVSVKELKAGQKTLFEVQDG